MGGSISRAGRQGGVERARRSYQERAWTDAFQAFADADRDIALGGEDLECMALAAYLIGRDDDYLKTLERAHNAHRDAGQRHRAARCGFWLGFRLLMRGEAGHAGGWFARGQRLIEHDQRKCAEHGYLLLPVVEQRIASADHESAYTAAAEAAAIGAACGDVELVACARHQQGRIRLDQGRFEGGLALLDETMIMVRSGELSPMVTGLMYCSVIAACQQVYALDRTREWTSALEEWCEGQPDMVAFAGVCQVHRAEIMQLLGTWPEAIETARRACARAQGVDRRATAAAFYQQGELHRLKGDFPAAEAAYRDASQHGLEPQPGLALLRLVQGRADVAAASMTRVLDTCSERPKRLSLLPAHVEIMLATGDVTAARAACEELERIAAEFGAGVPGALAAGARGAVALAESDARAALGALGRAVEVWQRVEAPYAIARVRVLIGLACRALTDEDGATLELAAARATFERLGAAPDLARLDALTSCADTHGLTRRELQVLRLVATGDTNRLIASRLCLSEKTIDRHLSNIFTKLDVPSRTAATAFAYRHKLV